MLCLFSFVVTFRDRLRAEGLQVNDSISSKSEERHYRNDGNKAQNQNLAIQGQIPGVSAPGYLDKMQMVQGFAAIHTAQILR